ncbi:acetate uptake transporter [Methanolobus mangrovi]|uniref:Acetate uptake transporter n=1 Tax=Methanolobus mangrovi TaxID=3072977 RepID=A0AA51YFU5_9EURY|nr:acetate uptake transporter [Methanolobus mangrovi]WMW21301.1 acetate uptake transporter [Methanolobus mangrovi]
MEGEVTIKDTTGSPAPLGFLGLGFAATFAGLLNMGMFSDATMVIAMAITLGGFAQLFAGLELWKKGDTFAATAFTAFALWWFSYAYILLVTSVGLFGNVMPVDATFATSLAWYLLFWGIIATLLTFVTLAIGVKLITIVFVFLDLTFFTLALVNFGVAILPVAAIITLLLGLSSLYLGIALVMDEVGSKLIKFPVF